MQQPSASRLCQDLPGAKELPRPSSPAQDAASTPHNIHPPPLPVPSTSKAPPVPSSSTDVLRTCPPPADVITASQDPVEPGATDGGAEPEEVVHSSTLPQSEEVSPIQPMEQEVTESDAADTTADCPSAPRLRVSDSVEMESPGVASSEREQPDGDRCSSSDSIPSLAAALKELHQLLVSNNQAHSQSRSSSSSPSHPFSHDTDRVSPEPCPQTPGAIQPAPSTAVTAESSEAKANSAAAAALSDEEPSKCLVPDLSGRDEHLGGDPAETVEGEDPLQCPDSSVERRPDDCGQDEASNISVFQPDPEVPADPAGDLEFRQPPEGQHGRGVADGRASGSNTPDSLQTEHTFLSPITPGSREDVSSTLSSSLPPLAQAPQPSAPSPLLPPPTPFIEQFPAEHIQRIQAAGFSAREAVEALERAHGVVELALLALLARSITVPT